MMHTFTISLEPLNEPERKHWCGVYGCQATVLFHNEQDDEWVCWPHGELYLRRVRDWWTHEKLHAVVTKEPEKAEQPDPNQNKYTCQPYGVPKCDACLYHECRCD